MPAFLKKNHRAIFYLTWFVLGLVQASFTELQDDEAYYWVYSKFPAWGYFDHPPMTAMLIKAGTLFFTNELAVRIFPLLLNTLSLFIIEKITGRKNPFLFYAICLSLAVLQLAGFFAVPDIPLIFFTALLFLAYRNYLQQPSWKNTLLIGVVVAGLFYSKYHGALVVSFIILSNARLLRDPKIYVAGIVALLLFLPHLWWQYQHDWITFKYHLFERSSNSYDISYTTDYIAGELFICGPVAGLILLPATFLHRSKDKLDKALKFTAAGFFIFFFISSFKGRVEANWTAPVLIPMIVLGYQYLQEHPNWRKWFYRSFYLSILIVAFARVITIFNIIPAEPVVERYFAWQKWPQELKKKTNALPVVFINNYQRASKYWFYTGQLSYSLNNYHDRQNNYNYWPIEDSLLGKKVYIIDIYRIDTFPSILRTPLWRVGYRMDSNFNSFKKIMIQPDHDKYTLKTNDTLRIAITCSVPKKYFDYLRQHPEINQPIRIGVFNGSKWVKDIPCPISLRGLINNTRCLINVVPGLANGTYTARFAIHSDPNVYTINSENIKFVVE